MRSIGLDSAMAGWALVPCWGGRFEPCFCRGPARIEDCFGALGQSQLRQRQQESQGGFRALVLTHAVHVQRISATAGVRGIQLQAQIVPTEEPIECALRLLVPPGLTGT